MRRFIAALLEFRNVLRLLITLGAAAALVPVVIGSGSTTVEPIPEPSTVNSTVHLTSTPLPILPLGASTPRATGVYRQLSPIPTPTPGPNAQAFTFYAEPGQSGWIRSGERQPHWDERNLNVGFNGGQTYRGLLYFNLSSLPPGTRVQYASVELVGLSNDALGAGGEWRLMMLSPERMTDWAGNTAIDLSSAPTIAEIGTPLKSESLAVGRVNQYIFAPVQRSLLDEAVNGTGRVGFRLDGPVGEPSSLFRWEGATSSSRPVSLQPVLRIIASVGRFVVITNTPTPQSMLTAVAEAKTAAARATRYGTPTAFPRSFATVTPVVVITPRPSPANQETQAALNAQATFVAITIGTFTPTPPNWVTATPSFLVPYETLAPPTPTPTIAWDNLLRTPVPSSLRNTIIFMSNRFGYKRPLVMKPDGTVLGVLTGSEYYQLARTLDVFSPDRTRVAVVSAESSARLQIWMRERNSGNQALVTKGFKKTSYDPAWSPDGSRIVFVGTETGVPEIYVYDIGNQISRQLTLNSGLDVLNQVPSWSPDSRQIVFKSNRGTGHFQIWIMNADGSGLRNLSQSPWEDTDPVWVKID